MSGDRTGSRWGLRVLHDECRCLGHDLQTRASHRTMMSILGKIMGAVKAGELDQNHAYNTVAGIVRQHGPDKFSDFDKAWRYCDRRTTARGPRGNGQSVRHLDRGERVQRSALWVNQVVCADRRITQGGAKGASALAVCVYFATVATRTGTTRISESYSQIGEAVCMHGKTARNCRSLWTPHAREHMRGHVCGHSKECRNRKLCTYCEEHRHHRGDRVASIWDLVAVPYMHQPEGAEVGPCRDGAYEGQPYIDLGDPLCLPWHDRWVKRAGCRAPWRIWVQLDTHEGTSRKELIAATGFGKNQMSAYLRSMIEAGEVQESDPGSFVRLYGPSIYDDVSSRQHTGCAACVPLSARAA